MDEKNKQLLDQILKYAAERKIQIPADIVLKLSTIYAEDLYSELKQGQAPSEMEGKILMGTLRKLVEQIVLEEIPEFGLMNSGLVPAPGKAGLMLMSTGWKPYLIPSAPGGGGGGTGISDAPGDSQSYVRYNRTWIVMPPGVTQHSLLTGLDYASAGHTGFQPTLTGAATLALLLPVDGMGSGLDADLLDGNHAAAFQTALAFPLGADLGGTGIANAAASTLTLAAATSITGGGTLGLGGFTGSVPATGTFAMGAGTLTWATANNVAIASHTHAITGSPELCGNGTSQYQVMTTGAFPYIAEWSGYKITGTTGGTLTIAVANTKTLTLTATDSRNITFPITGTAAIGAGTLTSATTNDVTVNAHTHAITASTALVAAGTAQYQVLTTGANPYPAGWSGFYLDGTTGGKTVLAVTNTKTLTLTATDDYNLTIPATGTAALLQVANTFTASPQTISMNAADVARGYAGTNIVVETGPNDPSAEANVPGAGKDWTISGLITNNSYYRSYGNGPRCTSLSNDYTDYLKVTGFGFNIPAGDTIVGIKVEILAADSGTTTGNIHEHSIKLVQAGTIVGDDKSTGASLPVQPPFPTAYVSYGGTSEMWGVAWTPADINSATFGVAIAYEADIVTTSESVYVDHVRVTIYHTAANTNWSTGLDASDGGKYKISYANALGTNDYLIIDNEGYINAQRLKLTTSSGSTAPMLTFVNSSGIITGGISSTGTLWNDLGTNYINLYLGAFAGNTTHTGSQNLGIGFKALTALTTGTANTAIGYQALLVNTQGNYNFACGAEVLESNISGSYNTGLGYFSLVLNSTGSYNTGIGSSALCNFTGSYNTGLGFQAGLGVSGSATGSNNIFIGSFCAQKQTTAAYILLIDSGTSARASAAVELTNSIIYGVMASTPAAQTLTVNAALKVNPQFTTAAINTVSTFDAQGSGANNVGGALSFLGKTSTTASQAMGLDQWLWVNATHASRTARRVFNVYDTAIREAIRIEASGTAAMIGFLGAAAVVRPLATADLGVALSDLGLRVAGTAYPITTSGAVSFTGGVTTSGGRVEGVTTYTDTCNILTTDECVIFNKATAFTATMPAATVGQRFYFKNIGAGNVTLSFPGTDTVDEVDDDLIMTQYDSYTLICRLANKWVKV